MTEYYLVVKTDASDLSLTVTDRLQRGWQLYGEPFSTVNPQSGFRYWAQALVMK